MGRLTPPGERPTSAATCQLHPEPGRPRRDPGRVSVLELRRRSAEGVVSASLEGSPIASKATNHPAGRRLTRVFHWLFPSYRSLAMTVAVEVCLTLVGLPAWAHLAVAGEA